MLKLILIEKHFVRGHFCIGESIQMGNAYDLISIYLYYL